MVQLSNKDIRADMTNVSCTFRIFLLLIVGLFGVVGAFPSPTLAQSVNLDLEAQIADFNKQIEVLSQKILDYQNELKQVGADKKTLQSAIKSLDVQRNQVMTRIALTQKQIGTTQLEIKKLGTQIESTSETIKRYKTALGTALRHMNSSDSNPVVVQLLLSGGISEFWKNINEAIHIQNAFREKTQALQNEEQKLLISKSAVERKEKSLSEQKALLAEQNIKLASTVKSKSQLLAETKNKESEFQKLLAQAEAQLKSFSNFARNSGGAKLLPKQTVCDEWGCYYNQRDVTWGAQSLNGTEYSLASDGCLVTAMAMVFTHYGYKNVTPSSINANPDNFASYYPAYLLYTINVAGVTATRVTAKIDATLATGAPLVVGMKVKGGTHFVVLVSGKNGVYKMRDPFVPNAKDVNFTDYYTVKSIYSISRVVIS